MTKERTKLAVWNWQAVGVICFFGGILAALVGGLLTAGAWFLGSGLHPRIHFVGTALMALTIPLLLLAGCLLDWTERKPIDSRQRERGSVRLSHLITGALLFGALSLVPLELHAQQTIFNVPSTDVLDQGKVYFELDVSAKPSDSSAVSKFSAFVPRVVVGAGSHVEVGLNILGNVQPGADSTTLSPTIKWKPYQGKDNGLAIIVGDSLFVPVRNRAYNAGNYVYAEVSKTFKSGTRLTAGGYDFTRSVVAARNRAGGQFGFEQPVNKKVTIAADWYTGKHSAGYFTPGVIFKVGEKITGYAGYTIGNQNASRGNHFFLLEFGYNFN